VTAAVIARILSVFGIGLGSNTQRELGDLIERAIIKLDDLEDKVAQLRFAFETRSRELFEKTVMLLKRGEKSKAAIYAGEVSQVKNILKAIMAIENLVIMTKERLKTVRDTRELGRILLVFGAALDQVKDQAVAIYPNLSIAFENISRNVKSLIVETSIHTSIDMDTALISNEVSKIMDEALKKASETIKREFPEPPVAPVINAEARTEALKIPAPKKTKRSIEEVERLVLDYIKTHNGLLDIRDFTARYNVSKPMVLEAIHRLAEKGLIAVH